MTKSDISNKDILELLNVYIQKTNKLEVKIKILENNNHNSIEFYIKQKFPNVKPFKNDDLFFNTKDFNDFIKNKDLINNLIEIITKKCLDESFPIKAFHEKNNTLFMKTEETWKIVKNTDLEKILNYISSLLMRNLNSIENNENYPLFLKKILTITNKTNILKIKKEIYNQIKVELH